MHITVPSIEQLENVSELSMEVVIDMVGELKRQEKFLQKTLGYLLENLKSRVPEGEFDGERFRVVMKDQTQHRLDTASVKKEMGEEWYENHSKDIHMKVARFYVREAEQYVEL